MMASSVAEIAIVKVQVRSWLAECAWATAAARACFEAITISPLQTSRLAGPPIRSNFRYVALRLALGLSVVPQARKDTSIFGKYSWQSRGNREKRAR